MLNFKSGLQKAFGIAEKLPEVLAVVVKGEVTDEITKMVSDRGFNVEDPQAYDGSTIFIQKDAEIGCEGQLAVQLDDKTCVICTFAPFSDTDSFAQNIDQQGFLPGFDVALSVLRDTVFNALFDADNAKSAGEKVSTAVKEFGTHISGLAKALPKEAFKMDPSILKLSAEVAELVAKATEIDIKVLVDGVPTAAEVGASSSEAEFNSADGVDTGPKKNEGRGKSADEADENADETDEPKADVEIQINGETLTLSAEKVEALKALADTTEGKDEPEDVTLAASQDGDGSTVTEPKEEAAPELALKAILEEALKGVTAEIAKVSAGVDSLSERVEAAETVARKTDETLNGKTNASANGDRAVEPQGQATGAHIPLIDTGMRAVSLRAANE